MSKKISIMEQIEQMSKELDRLQGIKRLFERAVHNEFGLSVNEIHKILNDRQKMLKKNAEKRTAQSQQPAPAQYDLNLSQQPQQGSFSRTSNNEF